MQPKPRKQRGSMLGSSSHHKRSSHVKDEFCSVTVRKDDPKEKAGIRLEQEKSGRVRVSNVAINGLFAESEIEIGDIVLSINGKRLQAGEGSDALVDVVNSAKSSVTVVVKKTSMKPRNEPKAPKNMDEIQDNNKKTQDKFYHGKAKHNADGSLDVNYTSKDTKPTQKQEMTTISATKESKEDAGLTFQVHKTLLFVSQMAADSVFHDTDLSVGDRVVSICDMNFRSYADAKYAQMTVKKAKSAVTLVVEKGISSPFAGEANTAGASGKTTKKKSSSTSTTKIRKSCNTEVLSDDSDLSSATESSAFSVSEDGDDALSPLKLTTLREVVITAPKDFSKQDVGLGFRQTKNMTLVIDRISHKSIFLKTSLDVGDVILAINDVDFRKNPDKNVAVTTCQITQESVSLLVLQDESRYAEHEFNLDASSTNLTWQ